METCVLHTGIKASLMRPVLFRGIFLGAVGILLLIGAAVFIPLAEMSLWGPTLFYIGMGCIVIGLLPYRRFTRLEAKPDKLIREGSGHLTYYVKGKKILTLHPASIEKTLYIERGKYYGIGVQLIKAPKEKICVHTLNFNMRAFQEKSRRDYSCDLFFPYFTERSFQQLLDSSE